MQLVDCSIHAEQGAVAAAPTTLPKSLTLMPPLQAFFTRVAQLDFVAAGDCLLAVREAVNANPE